MIVSSYNNIDLSRAAIERSNSGMIWIYTAMAHVAMSDDECVALIAKLQEALASPPAPVEVQP